MEYLIDDLAEAKAFVASLSRKVVRQRFSPDKEWKPSHVVVVKVDGQVVAMADCVIFPGTKVANASLLAAPGYGGYAVKALLRLKQIVDAKHWQAVVKAPTAATALIARRYMDATYDLAAWEIAGELVEHYGQQQYLRPTPLLASDSFLRAHGLPPIRMWDDRSRNQVLAVVANPTGTLRSPDGFDLHPTELLALTFDLLDLPMEVRQHVTRTLMTMIAIWHEYPVPLHIGRHIKPKHFIQFQGALTPYRHGDVRSGLLEFRPQG